MKFRKRWGADLNDYSLADVVEAALDGDDLESRFRLLAGSLREDLDALSQEHAHDQDKRLAKQRRGEVCTLHRLGSINALRAICCPSTRVCSR